MKAHTAGRAGAIGLPELSERHQVHIVNPAAGGGRWIEAARSSVKNIGGEIRESTAPGGVTELVRELFRKEPTAHAVVYGGDGTVFEAVNGIMQSGANRTASFSVIPAGSGNDFSAYVNDSGKLEKYVITPIDLIRVEAGGEVRYCANMMNIGFDCSVVVRTYALKKKPLFRGSAAYIAGAALELLRKKTTDVRIRLSGLADPDTGAVLEDTEIAQKMLLTAAANGSFCGGGFRALPLAQLDDGYMDFLVVNDVSRARFVALVGEYRAGTYLDERGVPKDRFRKILRFVRCRSAVIEGPERFCLDGEIFPTGEDRAIRAEVVPAAVNYAAV